MKYRALQTLWHTKEERHIEVGEECELSHVDEETIKILIEARAIEKGDYMKYRAITVLWHTGEERHIEVGEECELSHLDEETIQTLIAARAIESVNGGG